MSQHGKPVANKVADDRLPDATGTDDPDGVDSRVRSARIP